MFTSEKVSFTSEAVKTYVKCGNIGMNFKKTKKEVEHKWEQNEA